MKRQHKKAGRKTPPKESKFTKSIDKMGLTEAEAIDILRSLRTGHKAIDPTKITISGDSFCFGYFSDAHIGSKYFNPELFAYMVKFFQQEKPDFILDAGDHLEGMSGRPGHVYELSQVGFGQQFKYAVELYKQLAPIPIHGIDGNHDMWYFQKGDQGIVVGEELEKHLANYHNLGQSEGVLEINGIRIMLYHGGDGTAYATSYKLQKLIESFSNGMKPHIVLSGHYHKALYMFSRGVHGLECATLCGQTGWMKGKKIPAHMGFGIVRVFYNHRGVERFVHEFIPWYEK
jgi:DNA polymerase II small subunit/DNA polymerase delta subunit B